MLDRVEGWLGVELRHLAALSAVHQERSFRGAAERLGYVQSAVSQQISQLERLVGARLVDRARGHAPVALTEAGLLLLEHGTRILAHLDAAQADLRTVMNAETVRVGVTQSVASTLLNRTLQDLQARAPQLAIEIEEVPADRALFARVEAGTLDIAFGEIPLEPGPFEWIELLADPCVLLVTADSEAAAAGIPASLGELVALPLIRVSGWPHLDLIERQLTAEGLEPKYTLRADGNATIQALVGAGCGSAIMPRMAVQEHDPRVLVWDIGHLLPPRRLVLYWNGSRQRRDALDLVRGAVVRAAEMQAERDDVPAS
jgi:DNA-binding transcriptional LysR family regulator